MELNEIIELGEEDILSSQDLEKPSFLKKIDIEEKKKKLLTQLFIALSNLHYCSGGSDKDIDILSKYVVNGRLNEPYSSFYNIALSVLG